MRNLAISSVIPGLVFPALSDGRGNALLALLYQLEQSQWWSPEQLLRQQLSQLRSLLNHAAAEVPFYRRGPFVEISRAETLNLDAWYRLPILTRADVQTAADQMLACSIPASHGETDEIFTSGSTGKPVRVVRTRLSGLFWSAFTLRDHLWHGRDLRGKLCGIRQSKPGQALYPEGEHASSWGASSGTVFTTGPYAGLNITTPLEQQADWLVREDPDYLLTHPSVAWRLAQYFSEHSMELGNLKQVLTISESLPAGLRELCRAAWRVPVIDLYSSREAGYIALQCPANDLYHVQTEGIFVEVLDDSGRPCSPGQPGRVVVTPLHNFAMPLLRYDLGDVAELGTPCSCGRGLPVIARIMGRRQNMLLRPDGREIWPLLSSADISALLSAAPIRRYQIAQTSIGRLELRVDTAEPLSEGQSAALAKMIADKFSDLFSVAVRRTPLEPGPSGKFEDVVRTFEIV